MPAPQPSLRRARLLAAVWGLVLFGITSFPRPPEIPGLTDVPGADKGTHFLLYAVEGFLLYRAIAWPGRAAFALTRVVTVAGVLAVWGMVDEIHQLWIPGRDMEGGDWIADVAGGLLGALAASLASRRQSEPR